MLAGGTALSGYYAGHRRSDDLDLFCRDPEALAAAALGVRALREIGTAVSEKYRSAEYARFVCALENHRFTVDAVLDPNLFRVGHAIPAADRVHVADLPTLLASKGAALAGRCAEKDLYDMLWLLGREPSLDAGGVIERAQRIDGGVNGETLLLALSGTALREEACDFALAPGKDARTVFREITALRDALAAEFKRILEHQPAGPLKDLVDRIRRLRGR